MPTAASTNATPANNARSDARNRAGPCELETSSSSGRTVQTGWSLSTDQIAFRTSLATFIGGTAVRATRLEKINGTW